MTFDEMKATMDDARNTLSRADHFANAMAMMLRGRLRQVSGYALKELKAELRSLDGRTGSWRS